MNLEVSVENYNMKVSAQTPDYKTNCKLNIPWCVGICYASKYIICGGIPDVLIAGMCGILGTSICLDCLPDTRKVVIISSNQVVTRQPEVNREHID